METPYTKKMADVSAIFFVYMNELLHPMSSPPPEKMQEESIRNFKAKIAGFRFFV